MTGEEQKREVKAYVKALETNYNDTIREQKSQIEKLQKRLKKTLTA
jgi:hypothetical protein